MQKAAQSTRSKLSHHSVGCWLALFTGVGVVQLSAPQSQHVKRRELSLPVVSLDFVSLSLALCDRVFYSVCSV